MKTQEEITYDIMTVICPARTELIKIACMRRGISCGDRYLRWLSKRGIIENIGKVEEGDRTDTWIIKKPYSPKSPDVKEKPPENLFNVERYSLDI